MTGYGAATKAAGGITTNVELKTLNSKFLDVNMRIPRNLSDKELELRSVISDVLERGKVSISIDIQNEAETQLKQKYNKELFKKYYEQLEGLAESVGAGKDELFRTALNAPDVIITSNDQETDLDYEQVVSLLKDALNECDAFRAKEGQVLAHKLEGYIASIDGALTEVEKLDPERVARIRARIEGNLAKVVEEEGLDKNRLEQELIYYIEKLDITEEKVRLRNHLEHFSEVMSSDQSQGKKLGFISQEIGREINTIGSKANDSAIQRHVVIMKEELEKIKEQLLNVL